MNDMAKANKSSRFEVIGALTVLGYPAVLLKEVFSGEWSVTVNVQNSLGDDGVPVTAHGKDREEAVRKATNSVRSITTWLGARAA